MKAIQSILLLAVVFTMAGTYTSCNKNATLPNGGVPRIRYVRVTNPVSSDSLLVGAYQSNLIAIIGENLQDTRQIWFNDQRATLTPTYITPTSILVTTPSKIPTVIDNKMKLVMANGDTLYYPFKILVNAPLVSSMYSEFVPAGGVATIRGNYFYKPVSVAFTGGGTGEIVSVTDQEIQVKVPASAQSGQLIVTTNFGVTKSNFWFNDTRNIFIGSDPFEGWNNSSLVVTNPGPNDPPKINGNYFRIKTKVGSWSWNELADGDAGSMPSYSKKIPDDAILHPDQYNLKFEVNTMKPYNNSMVIINAGGSVVQDTKGYKWAPPFDTKGLWQTVVVPYEEVVASYSAKPVVNPNGYWTMVLMQGPGDLDCDMSFDNFRVVPKIIKP